MNKILRSGLAVSLRAIIVLTLVCGVLYPLMVTGIAQVAMPHEANGSQLMCGDQSLGSEMVGQSFVNPETGYTLPGYFRGRPSAVDYGTTPSGASNLGPMSAALIERIFNDAAIIRDENGLDSATVLPIDLVTASGSGVDPHISVASAELQVARVASERGLTEEEVRAMIDDATEGPSLGFLGQSGVNVVKLNLALDGGCDE